MEIVENAFVDCYFNVFYVLAYLPRIKSIISNIQISKRSLHFFFVCVCERMLGFGKLDFNRNMLNISESQLRNFWSRSGLP